MEALMESLEILTREWRVLGTQVSPLLSQQWKEHVEGVGQTLMERFRAIRADDARRTRFVSRQSSRVEHVLDMHVGLNQGRGVSSTILGISMNLDTPHETLAPKLRTCMLSSIQTLKHRR
jgi:hypothetical protein